MKSIIQSTICLIVLTAVWSYCCAASAAQPGNSGATTRPGLTGLVAAVDKRYEDIYLRRGAEEWSRLLQGAYTFDKKRFDLAARDRLMVELGRLVDGLPESKRDLRVVVVEMVYQGGTDITQYDRTAVFWHPSKPSYGSGTLSKMGLFELLPQQAQKFEAPVQRAMKVGGSSNGIKSNSHTADCMVISYFDGTGWRQETWFWLTMGAYMAVETGDARVGRRDSLPEPTRSLVLILDLLQPYGPDGKNFGHPVYRDLLDSFPREQERVGQKRGHREPGSNSR